MVMGECYLAHYLFRFYFSLILLILSRFIPISLTNLGVATIGTGLNAASALEDEFTIFIGTSIDRQDGSSSYVEFKRRYPVYQIVR